MAWIPIYADEDDFIQIMEKLNADNEIAHIVSKGTRTWITCSALENITDGVHSLWHMPGGPLVLFEEGKTNILGNRFKRLFGVKGNMLEAAGWVKDPFKGWKGPQRADAEHLPFLGNSPNVIELRVQRKGKDSDNSIGVSGFGWIGNRHGSIGQPAAKSTMNWWRRLNSWVSKKSVSKIPSSGPLDGKETTVWTFPSAYGKIRNGMKRDLNPF